MRRAVPEARAPLRVVAPWVLLLATLGPRFALADAADGGAGDGAASPAPSVGSDSSKSREDEMFGGSPSPAPDAGTAPEAQSPPAIPAAPPAQETAVNPGVSALAPVDERALFRGAEEMNNKLTIGGLVYAQAQYEQEQDVAPHTLALSSPNLADLYFDARPNDELRAYIRGRLVYSPTLTGASPNQLTTFGTTLGTPSCTDLCPYLDQFWLKWNIAHRVFFTLGRQHIKWGAGRFWNPTDFLNPVKLNPLDIIDQRLGVDMLKVHVPVESKEWNFYGIVTIDGATSLQQIGYAARAEFTAGPSEITASAAYTDGHPLKLGTDISAGVGDFDLHAEAALLHPYAPGQLFHYNGTLDLSSLTMLAVPHPQDLDHLWLPQVVAGGEYSIRYSDQDSLLLGAEGFYNRLGYTNSTVYPILLLTPNAFVPLYNGQFYGAAYISLPNPGDWNNTTFQLSWIGNLSDNSHVARLDYRVTVLTFLQLNAYGAYFFGSNGEFHYSTTLSAPTQVELNLIKQFYPQYAAVASQIPAGGLAVHAGVWAVGGGMIVNL